MRNIFLIIFFIAVSFSPLSADSYAVSWTDTLIVPRNNNAEDIVVTENGIYVLGSVDNGDNLDGLLAEYDFRGNLMWVDTIDFGNEDYFYGIAADKEGFIYIAGRVNDGGTANFTLIKMDSLGNQVWIRSIDNGSGDAAYDVTVDDYNNVYATGYTYIENVEDYLTVKFTSSGDVVWMDTFNITQYDMATGISVDSSGNVYVTGYCYMSYGPNYDYVTVKYDSLGNVVWVDTFGGPGIDYVLDIAVDREGNAYLTGSIAIGNDKGYLTLKYDPYGNLVWADTVGVRYQDMGKDIFVDNNGYIYVTGSVYSFDNDADCLTMKYDPDGNVVWADTMDVEDGIDGRGIFVDDMGNIYITATLYLLNNNNMLTLKYEPVDEVHEDNSTEPENPLLVSTLSKGKIYLRWKENEGAVFYLYTPIGRLVKTGEVFKEAHISNIKPGIYFLRVSSSGFALNKKKRSGVVTQNVKQKKNLHTYTLCASVYIYHNCVLQN